MSIRVDQFIVSDQANINTAMQIIDQNGMGAVFVVDASGRMCGMATDGDIRRALLQGHDLTGPIRQVMRTDYVSLPHTATQEEVLNCLSDPIKIIPLLDTAGRPVNYACYHRYHEFQVMEPSLDGKELIYLTECIMKNWISSQGGFVTRFEKRFAEFIGMEEAFAVSNGTVALHLALTALGIGAGNEVIVPDLTFAASVNAILYTGATPVLVDVCPDTWTMDPGAVARAITPKTKAIMPVHLYGHPCHMDEIRAIAADAGCLIVEDCAESLGSEYKGAKTGSLGDAGCFSFFGNKVLTTGEGGMVVFKDREAGKRARILRDHGMSPARRYWHEYVGFNYRLTNLQAAVGVAQMERIGKLFNMRDTIFAEYDQHLKGIEGIELLPRSPWGRHVPWLYCILLSDIDHRSTRDEMIAHLKSHGIQTRPLFYPIHEMPPYRHLSPPGARYPVSERLSYSGISLPSGYSLTASDIRYICSALKQSLPSTLIV